MDDEIIIEFSRTKAESKKIYFRRLWLKQVMLNIILGILLSPVWIMLGMAFGTSFAHRLGLGENSSIVLSMLMIGAIYYYFFAPVFKLYFIYKKHINEMYGDRTILYNTLVMTKDRFKYQNESFCLEAPWSNTKIVKMDKEFIQFQMKQPIVSFWIPTPQVSSEVKSLLLASLPKM